MSAPSQFKSKYKAFQAIVRHGYPILHPVTGTKTGEVKQLMAEFGVHRGEVTLVDDDGNHVSTHADIAGHYYDLDADAEKKGWSEDEKEAVRGRLLQLATEWPEAVQVHETRRAVAPWPTYDTTHHNKVAALASELGLVQQALDYERENKARVSVIADLEKLVSSPEPAPEELTAA